MSSMSGNEERRVKARHEVTQYYKRRKVVTRRELPRADMTIEGEPNAARGEESSEDDDVEDETYVPSPWAQPHAEERGLLVAAMVAVGLQKWKRKVMMMSVMRRKKYLMLKRSNLHHMLI
jgi:hypothetical protein